MSKKRSLDYMRMQTMNMFNHGMLLEEKNVKKFTKELGYLGNKNKKINEKMKDCMEKYIFELEKFEKGLDQIENELEVWEGEFFWYLTENDEDEQNKRFSSYKMEELVEDVNMNLEKLIVEVKSNTDPIKSYEKISQKCEKLEKNVLLFKVEFLEIFKITVQKEIINLLKKPKIKEMTKLKKMNTKNEKTEVKFFNTNNEKIFKNKLDNLLSKKVISVGKKESSNKDILLKEKKISLKEVHLETKMSPENSFSLIFNALGQYKILHLNYECNKNILNNLIKKHLYYQNVNQSSVKIEKTIQPKQEQHNAFMANDRFITPKKELYFYENFKTLLYWILDLVNLDIIENFTLDQEIIKLENEIQNEIVLTNDTYQMMTQKNLKNMFDVVSNMFMWFVEKEIDLNSCETLEELVKQSINCLSIINSSIEEKRILHEDLNAMLENNLSQINDLETKTEKILLKNPQVAKQMKINMKRRSKYSEGKNNDTKKKNVSKKEQQVEIRLETAQIEYLKKNPIPLLTIIENSELRKYLFIFLQLEFSNENLLAYLKISVYKNLYIDSLEFECLNIYETFIKSGSRKQININAKIKLEIEKNIQEKNFEGIFDKASDQIFELMSKDTYYRFVKSPSYENMLKTITSTHKNFDEIIDFIKNNEKK